MCLQERDRRVEVLQTKFQGQIAAKDDLIARKDRENATKAAQLEACIAATKILHL